MSDAEKIAEECAVEDCRREAVVGLNGEWVCLEHFEESLRGHRANAAALSALMGNTDGM